jgi:hypothetical protein
MFDYIYSNIHNISTSEILLNQNLEFTTSVNLTTGEIGYCNKERKHGGVRKSKNIKRANFNGLTVKVTNDIHINLEGSLHEFSLGNNYSQFSVNTLRESIQKIERELNITAQDIRLHNLEFGVNIILPFPVELFLDSILSYKGRDPDVLTYKGTGNMRRFTFDQYELKLYDKGLQYSIPGNLLRVEVKVTRMHILQKNIEVRTLNDLLRREIYPHLLELLLDPLRVVLMAEYNLPLKNLTTSERRLYKDGNTRTYWKRLVEKNKRQYWKKAKKYRELIDREGTMKIRETVIKLVSETWNKLSECSIELADQNGNELTDQDFTNDARINTYTNKLICTPTNQEQEIELRFCKSCGRDISTQKPGSIFCSESRYGREAKRCRNQDSNPRNYFLRREKIIEERGLLFDINPFLVMQELRRVAC